MASCTSKQEAMLSSEEEAQTDSLTLRIAVMPVMDCLPIYYAQRTGLMKDEPECPYRDIYGANGHRHDSAEGTCRCSILGSDTCHSINANCE